MRILVIDGQGGGIGSKLTAALKPRMKPGWALLAAGTNVAATSAMLKAGAQRGATGENAVCFNAARADIILGPIGILLVNGLMGEVSPAAAAAVSGSQAVKILIPSNSCGILVAGTEELKLDEYIRRAADLAIHEAGGE